MRRRYLSRKVLHGFTLMELLVAIAIIGILAVIVVVAVNPQRQLLKAEDAKRLASAHELESAVQQQLVDAAGQLPYDSFVPRSRQSARHICRQGVFIDISCISLDTAITSRYIVSIPQDSIETCPHYSGYSMYREGDRYHVLPDHLSATGGLVASPDCVMNWISLNGDQDSNYPLISEDGRHIIFDSFATTLVTPDANGAYPNPDIIAYDRPNPSLKRLNTKPSDGSQVDGYGGLNKAMSRNGRFVAFVMPASAFIPGGNSTNQVFVLDRDADGNGTFDEARLGATSVTAVSVNDAGALADQDVTGPSISDDGRLITFRSSFASNLDYLGRIGSVYVHNRDVARTGTFDTPGNIRTEVADVSTAGVPGNGMANQVRISGDGSKICFESNATNLTADDNAAFRTHIYLRDLTMATTKRVSVVDPGFGTVNANGSSQNCTINRNGTYISYDSTASNLVPVDTNARKDVFLYNVATGVNTLISKPVAGASNGISFSPSVADDGSVAYISDATNITTAVPTPGTKNVFVYHTGDGSTNMIPISYSGFFYPQNLALSADGLYVVFSSNANNLTPGDTNNRADVFTIVSTATSG